MVEKPPEKVIAETTQLVDREADDAHSQFLAVAEDTLRYLTREIVFDETP